MKMTYLLSYDISSNKRRLKCANHLLDVGAKRIQKSVFVINARKPIANALYSKLEGMKEMSDLLLMVRLDTQNTAHLSSGYGFPFSVFQGKDNLIFI